MRITLVKRVDAGLSGGRRCMSDALAGVGVGHQDAAPYNAVVDGDPAPVALLPIASLLESSAAGVEALPRDFWLRR
jgi:hypothetical protein